MNRQFEETFDFNQEPLWAIESKAQWPFRGLHIHNGLEVGVVEDGHGILNYNGIKHPLKPGTLFFFDASMPHWHLSHSGNTMQLKLVVFPAMSIPAFAYEKNDIRLLKPFLAARVGFPPVLPPHETVMNLIDQIVLLYTQKKMYWDLQVLPRLSRILVEIACQTLPQIQKDNPRFSSQVNTITQALYHINLHYCESFSIEELANLCHLSPSHFSHLFKEIVGLSPLKYRDHLRIAHAIEQLLFTRRKTAAIAMECGFSDETRFGKTFKALTGNTPSEYRKHA